MEIKIGFVGAGLIASIHLERLSKIGGIKISAVCDINKEQAQKAARNSGAAVYSDYKKMFNKEKLDACYICVPPFAHSDIELMALEKNINLLVEKPVSLSLNEAKKIENAINNKKGVIVMVGYVLRYFDLVEKIKELLKNKKVALVSGKYFCGIVPAPWWTLKDKSGGQVVEQSTHIIDLCRYLIGEVDTVYARGFSGLNKGANYDIDDASVVSLNFKHGTIGALSSTCLLNNWGPEIDIVTKDLHIKMNNFSNLTVIDKGQSEEIKSNEDFYLSENKVFIDAVKRKDTSRITSAYSDAIKTLELTLAVNESIKTGKIVKL